MSDPVRPLTCSCHSHAVDMGHTVLLINTHWHILQQWLKCFNACGNVSLWSQKHVSNWLRRCDMPPQLLQASADKPDHCVRDMSHSARGHTIPQPFLMFYFIINFLLFQFLSYLHYEIFNQDEGLFPSYINDFHQFILRWPIKWRVFLILCLQRWENHIYEWV